MNSEGMAHLSSRLFAIVALGLATAGVAARDDGRATTLFSSYSVLHVRLEAPINELFAGSRDTPREVSGTLSYTDDATGREIVLEGVRVSLRGHTSKAEAECAFPKLKLRFKAGEAVEASLFRRMKEVKVGTHCGERPDSERTPKGRLANDKAPFREAFVYRLLEIVGVPSLKARPAEITYVDAGKTLVRKALFVEDLDDTVRRLGAERELPVAQFTNGRDTFAAADGVKLALAEALIGNFDWCVRWTPDDTYRCDARDPLWNVAVLVRPQARALPLMYDFDLTGMVTGPHNWFPRVFNEGFLASRSRAEIQAMAQVQRTRSLFSRAELNAARQQFIAKKAAIATALEEAALDPGSHAIIKSYVDGFFRAIETDAAFYRPVITAPNVMPYLDAGGTKPACDVAIAIGSPVAVPVEKHGEMVRANVLDVLWKWDKNKQCDAARSGPVWLNGSSISADYPKQ
jgi:hypothetical protein